MYIQILVNKMDPTFQHILARLLCTSQLFNHCTQLTLQTCWLSTRSKYQINESYIALNS